MNEILYTRLIAAACQGEFLRYAEAGATIGLDMSSPADRDEISRLLDEISVEEHRSKRPLLSAIVIHAQDNIPGNGFFTMAERLGRFDGRDRLRFWIDESTAVRKHWAMRVPPTKGP